jgi:hypothetical protein
MDFEPHIIRRSEAERISQVTTSESVMLIREEQKLETMSHESLAVERRGEQRNRQPPRHPKARGILRK